MPLRALTLRPWERMMESAGDVLPKWLRGWRRVAWFCLLGWMSAGFSAVEAAGNRVLALEGTDGCVRIPQGAFAGIRSATIECWVRFDAIGHYSTLFSFGKQWQSMTLSTSGSSDKIRFFIYDSDRELHMVETPSLIPVREWIHLAAVTGPGGMKLYLDGVLVGSDPFGGSFQSLGDGRDYFIGKAHWIENSNLAGAVDEFRIWRAERTQEEIRRDRFRRLTGSEPDLVGLWNFDEGDARDSSPLGNTGVLSGTATFQEHPFFTKETTRRALRIQGTVRDASGNPEADAVVRFYDGEVMFQSARTTGNGSYDIGMLDLKRPIDLLAISSSSPVDSVRGGWRRDVVLEPPGNRIDFDLTGSVGISGTISCMDGQPQPGKCVELLSGGQVVQRTLSDVKGDYAFPAVRAGRYQVRCVTGRSSPVPEKKQVESRTSRTQSEEFHLAADASRSDVNLWFPPPGNKGVWRLIDSSQGLPFQRTTAARCTPDGCVWFGTYGGGVVRFDGGDFTLFDRANGFSSNEVVGLEVDPGGVLWVATSHSISRWDGRQFTHFRVENQPIAFHVTALGRVLWSDFKGVSEMSPSGPRRVAGVPARAFFRSRPEPPERSGSGVRTGFVRWKGNATARFFSRTAAQAGKSFPSPSPLREPFGSRSPLRSCDWKSGHSGGSDRPKG